MLVPEDALLVGEQQAAQALGLGVQALLSGGAGEELAGGQGGGVLVAQVRGGRHVGSG